MRFFRPLITENPWSSALSQSLFHPTSSQLRRGGLVECLPPQLSSNKEGFTSHKCCHNESRPSELSRHVFRVRMRTPSGVWPFKCTGTGRPSRGSYEMRDLVIFVRDKCHFCLIIKQKAGWLTRMGCTALPAFCF